MTPTLRSRRGPAALALAAMTTLLAVAPAAQARPARCRASDLSVRLGRTHAGAGQRFATLIVRNRTHATCRTYGYVGMRLRDRGGKPLPTDVVRVRHDAVGHVRLQPGDHAFARLRWGAVPGEGEPVSADCEPTPARVEVTPPDDTDQDLARWRDGPVCEYGRIEAEPLHDRRRIRAHASASWPRLRRGDRGFDVRVVQLLLDAHGRRLAIDGIYGPGTAGAIRQFQSGHHLRDDGVVGPRTWRQLIVRLRRGDRGDAVRAAQIRLRENEEYHGPIDGIFGGGTVDAVRSFQRHERLRADGVVGPHTWQSLLTHGRDREHAG